jgi:hypothetical protein
MQNLRQRGLVAEADKVAALIEPSRLQDTIKREGEASGSKLGVAQEVVQYL